LRSFCINSGHFNVTLSRRYLQQNTTVAKDHLQQNIQHCTLHNQQYGSTHANISINLWKQRDSKSSKPKNVFQQFPTTSTDFEVQT
jgi:hypothetical protein